VLPTEDDEIVVPPLINVTPVTACADTPRTTSTIAVNATVPSNVRPVTVRLSEVVAVAVRV
jgi:hypothetical protein